MKLKYTFEMMEMDTDMIAVPVGEDSDEFGGLVKLNYTASEIFTLIEEEKTEEDIIKIMSERYEIDQDTMSASVNRYLSKLETDGLLIR